MRFIAHRGNLEGPKPGLENTVDYLQTAFDECYGIEVDLQTVNGVLYLGHDNPQEIVTHTVWKLLEKPGVYCHAKDLQSLALLITHNCETFYHTNEDIVFTSKGKIWCYPGIYHPDIQNSIWLDCHQPIPSYIHKTCYAVCGDNINTI